MITCLTIISYRWFASNYIQMAMSNRTCPSGEPCKVNIQNGSQKKIEVVQEDVAVLVGCTLIYVS
jgi:hypothetical protein